MRDMEKTPTYDAEHELRFILTNGGTFDFYGSTLVIPEERKFGTIENVRDYVTKVCEFELVNNMFTAASNPPAVRARRGNRWAHYEPATHTIAVPEHKGSNHSWAMREIVVLHELAHAFTRGHGHDALFRGSFAWLVGAVIGREAELLLVAAYDSRGLSVQIPEGMIQ